MNEGTSFLKELGRSYIVSSFLPSAFFVSITLVLFKGFISPVVKQTIHTGSLKGFEWLLIIILMSWVAFFLFSSVDWVVKVFEGYYFPKYIKRVLANSFRKNRFRHSNYYPWASELVRRAQKRVRINQDPDPRDVGILGRHYFETLAELQDLELYGKHVDKDFMPTLLGNVLRSSELYAYERYLIEGITIWPRLFPTLPKPFVDDMEEKKNHLMFLLNSSLLTYVIGILSLIAAILGMVAPSLQGFQVISAWEYLGLCIFSSLFGYTLYRISVNASIDHTLFIRVAFDLYRKNLIKQLDYELPLTLEEERNLWLEITEYLIAGSTLSIYKAPILSRHYVPQKDSPDQTEPDLPDLSEDLPLSG